jgi:hypothetical protein
MKFSEKYTLSFVFDSLVDPAWLLGLIKSFGCHKVIDDNVA